MKKYIIQMQFTTNNKINCIRIMREAFNLGLKPAKDFVDESDDTRNVDTRNVLCTDAQLGRLYACSFEYPDSIDIRSVEAHKPPLAIDFSTVEEVVR